MRNSQSLEINVVFLCSFWSILLFLVGVTFAPSISNASTNATGELMTQAENVLNLTSDAASNATQTAMNTTMNLFSNESSNVSDTMSNASTNETVLDVNEEANK